MGTGQLHASADSLRGGETRRVDGVGQQMDSGLDLVLPVVAAPIAAAAVR